MSYSIDYRRRVLEYLEEGHTQKEAQEVFKISSMAIKEWKRLLSETGSLEKRPRTRKASVYKSDELRAYIKEHPQAFLKEIAEHFGGSISGADSALSREELTLKKQHQATANATK
jgi:transposase